MTTDFLVHGGDVSDQLITTSILGEAIDSSELTETIQAYARFNATENALHEMASIIDRDETEGALDEDDIVGLSEGKLVASWEKLMGGVADGNQYFPYHAATVLSGLRTALILHAVALHTNEIRAAARALHSRWLSELTESIDVEPNWRKRAHA